MITKQLSYEQEKLLLLKKGDRKVFENIFNEYYTILVRLSLNILKQEEVAEEVVQDVFVKLWEKRKDISIQVSLKSYLAQSVKNKSLNYLKSKEGKYQQLSKIEVEDYLIIDEETQHELEFLEFQYLVEKSINSLPDRSQQIFKLSRFEGLSYSKIADKLDISVKAVEKQMNSSLKKMREFLGVRNR